MGTEIDIEIRKLTPGNIFKLIQILESGEEDWKKLMSVIPIECKEGNPLKYTVDHMSQIERAARCQNRPYSEILLDEWGTSGRCRPTLTFLLNCLLKAQLYRAADFVALDLLHIDAPERPENGPAARVKYPEMNNDQPITNVPAVPTAPPKPESQPEIVISNPTSLVLNSSPTVEVQVSSTSSPDVSSLTRIDVTVSSPVMPASPSPPRPITPQVPTAIVEPDCTSHVVPLSYDLLEAKTGGFKESCKLGSGGFGSVYLANLPTLGAVAIKRFHNSPDAIIVNPIEQFNNEIQVLAHLSHNNLLPLLGYSSDGPALCLAYKFMKHGSLQDQLACKNNKTPLSWRTRLNIALGTSKGISHLHTALPKPLVHRDVKSANILLDDNFTAKLGDFGLVRLGSSASNTKSKAITSNVIGTSAYMSPEAMRGDVSVKMDVFSFGVVLLELITGLAAYDEDRGEDGVDLLTYVDGMDDRNSLVDPKAGDWPSEKVDSMFKLADQCLVLEKKSRTFIGPVIQALENICI